MSSSKDIAVLVNEFVHRLKRKQVVGSYNVAIETATLLRSIVSNTRWKNASHLMKTIKDIGVIMVRAQPIELAVGNIVRRILHIIREEYVDDAFDEDELPSPKEVAFQHNVMRSSMSRTSSSMFNLLAENVATTEVDYTIPKDKLKAQVIQQINELIDDLLNLEHHIAVQALEHIHSNEVIMTMGSSKTVELFLKHAAKKRTFQVIVAESSPTYGGQSLAVSLAKEGIDTIVIPDSAVFAMMGRVNKIIVGTHAVTANGGLVSIVGTHTLSLAAKHHSTPVVVVAGLFKLTPVYPHDHHSLNIFVSPQDILPFNQGEFIRENVSIVAPYFDYVEPELVSLFVTNMGGHPPSYIYRLLEEMYDPRDFVLQ